MVLNDSFIWWRKKKKTEIHAYFCGTVTLSHTILAAPPLIQLCAQALGKAAEDGPRVWAAAIQVDTPNETPGCWLQHGPAPAIVAS